MQRKKANPAKSNHGSLFLSDRAAFLFLSVSFLLTSKDNLSLAIKMKFFSKESIESDIPVTDDLQYGDVQGSVADRPSAPKVGELDFDESTRGGLGRHLGIWSTIFLM